MVLDPLAPSSSTISASCGPDSPPYSRLCSVSPGANWFFVNARGSLLPSDKVAVADLECHWASILTIIGRPPEPWAAVEAARLSFELADWSSASLNCFTDCGEELLSARP